MTLTEQLAAVAARWDHGHDQLTDDCALCHAEWADAVDTQPCHCPCHPEETPR